MAFDIKYHRQLADHGVESPDIQPQEVCNGLAAALDHAADVQARFVAYVKRETAVIRVEPGAIDVILRNTLEAHEKREAALAEHVVRLEAERGYLVKHWGPQDSEHAGEARKDMMLVAMGQVGDAAVARHREEHRSD